jgi:hypothetical protein
MATTSPFSDDYPNPAQKVLPDLLAHPDNLDPVANAANLDHACYRQLNRANQHFAYD